MNARRIVRIALIGDPVDNARANLVHLAQELRAQRQTPVQAERLATMLQRISLGEKAESVLGLNRDPKAARDPDRTRIMALDYVMRDAQSPRLRSIFKRVMNDWKEGSVDTVKQIVRRERKVAEHLFRAWLNIERRDLGEHFDVNVSAALLWDAVADARRAILSKTTAAAVSKRPEERIEISVYLEHLLRYYANCGA